MKNVDVYTIEILETKVKKLLDDLADLNLIKIQKVEKTARKPRRFGSIKGLVVNTAEDFDAPFEDFKNEK